MFVYSMPIFIGSLGGDVQKAIRLTPTIFSKGKMDF